METEITFSSEASYQLEMNLHKVRNELISMLEVYEQTNCLVCYQLKCKCTIETGDTSKNDTSPKSNKSDNSVAPPATSLPKPNFDLEESQSSTPEKDVQKDVEAWIDASIKEEQVIVKEASLLSQTDNLLLIDKQNTPQVAINYVNNGNAVEAFFKYFKIPSSTAVTYVSAKLTTACSKPAKQNYTYF